MILREQKNYKDKAGIGYNSNYQNKLRANKTLASRFYISKSHTSNQIHKSDIVCYRCDKVGHKSFKCISNKITKSKTKRIWVPKGITATNLKGSKKTWIPKNTT